MKPKEEKEIMSSNSTEAPLSLTFDITDPNGIKTLITMRGTSTELPEVSNLISDRDQIVENLLAEGWVPTVSNYGRGAAPKQESQTNQAPSQPLGPSSGPSCACGPMTFRSGISKKNGKPWSAHFCRADVPGHGPIFGK